MRAAIIHNLLVSFHKSFGLLFMCRERLLFIHEWIVMRVLWVEQRLLKLLSTIVLFLSENEHFLKCNHGLHCDCGTSLTE